MVGREEIRMFSKREEKYLLAYGFENRKISVTSNAIDMSLLWNVEKRKYSI